MGTVDRIKVVGGTQDKGLDNFNPDISAGIVWSELTQNVTGGSKRGVGPVYGIAPLGGHSNNETPAANQTNGLMRSTQAGVGAAGMSGRRNIFAILPITMPPYDGTYPKLNKQFYLYLVSAGNVVDVYHFDACFGATLETGVNKQASTFVAGLAQTSLESVLVRLHKTELANLPQPSAPSGQSLADVLENYDTLHYIPYAQILTAEKRVPYYWMLGDKTSTPNSTTAPNVNIWSKTFTAGNNLKISCGSPSEIITRGFAPNNERIINVYCLPVAGSTLLMRYFRKINESNTAEVSAYGSGDNYLSLTASTKVGGSAFGDVSGALVHDPGSFTNSKHHAVLLAGKRPLAIIYQDWLKAVKGMMPRWVDLTQPGCTPRNSLATFGDKTTAWNDYSTATAIFGLGANTGFLKQNTAYEFGFSYYNKLIDYETNVVFIFSVTVTDTNNFAVALYENGTAGRNLWGVSQQTSTAGVPWDFTESALPPGTNMTNGRGMHINDYEYRFYYRELGTSEWLPAGSHDAAKLWFYTEWPSVLTKSAAANFAPVICQGAVGNAIGGQANGFNDYSPLPKAQYTCVTTFQQRAFWFSDDSIHFSYANNIYAYATRNTLVLEGGKCRGGIVHMRTNDTEQQGRIVVFAGTTYAGRFTGERATQNIRVSVSEVGQFEIDGSDFVLDYLCDATAFSYRAAVIAEGILYWWGPQGVYRDDGLSEPKKISGILEPNIFGYVDMGRDKEVHCVYNKKSSEIIWFYPPKVTDATYLTYGLVFNVENGKFYPYKFKPQVDSSQNIQLENDTTPDGVDGARVLMHCRSAVNASKQFSYYFDDIVKSGQQGPNIELTVVSFTSPTTSTRRLVLATGSVGVTAGGIAIDDYICIDNAAGYAPAIVAKDMIAKITAVNNGASTIDIQLPTGATMDASAVLGGQTAFPIYHRKAAVAGLHGITYQVDTKFWLADGLSNSWTWQYIHFLFKYLGIPTPTDPFTLKSAVSLITLANKTLVCSGATTSVLNLINNSSGHCQIHKPLPNENRSANGQAIALNLSGIHIGDPWTLEYLEAHVLAEHGFTLKEFEG